MKHPKFGDRVTNVSAGDRNPHKHGIFVRVVRKTGKMNPGLWYECTDGKGDFWQTDPRSIVLATEGEKGEEARDEKRRIEFTPRMATNLLDVFGGEFGDEDNTVTVEWYEKGQTWIAYSTDYPDEGVLDLCRDYTDYPGEGEKGETEQSVQGALDEDGELHCAKCGNRMDAYRAEFTSLGNPMCEVCGPHLYTTARPTGGTVKPEKPSIFSFAAMVGIYLFFIGLAIGFGLASPDTHIESLTPDTEVYIDHREAGALRPLNMPRPVDLYLVLVNRPDDGVILLYNAGGYTASDPLILTYDEFGDMWLRR